MMFEKEYKEYLESKGKVSEDTIEKALIYHLVNNLGYTYREDIKEEFQLKQNFREHYERLNNFKFDDNDFEIFWNEFYNTFYKAFHHHEIIAKFKMAANDFFLQFYL